MIRRKKNLAIFIGYTSFSQDIYGTEIAIFNLANQLKRKYNVFIITIVNDAPILWDGITYINYQNFSNLSISLDVIIVSRYINYFIYCHFKCKKIYLWLHDVSALSYYKSITMDDLGRNFVLNLLPSIKKVIVLTEWHKNLIKDLYNIPDNKLKIIGNGINIFENNEIKQKNRFIWTSCLTRGIERLVDILSIVYIQFPDLKLHVFRDYKNNEKLVKELSEKYSFVKFYGKVDNNIIISEFKKSDIWFYPTTFNETFCISALEAQMSGCVAISTNVAALNTTVGDHGILLDDNMSNQELAEKLIEIMKDDNLKEKMRKKGIKWAREQNWINISKKWEKMIESFF